VRWQLGVLATGLLLASRAADAEPAHVALSAGYWGLRAHEPHEVAVQLELRPGVRWWWLRPTVGLLQSSEGTQVWFGGVLLEFPLPGGVVIAPGLAAGIRTLDGARNLGSRVLFKSSVELSAPLAPGARVLLSFAHTSNGKLAAPNPGIETLIFGLEVALE
jgi:Lipid A 3-O-deacylase (PagL)